MKTKFSSMGRMALALVLALSLSLVMAVPVAADVVTEGVTINSPTEAVPAYVSPGGSVDVNFDIQANAAEEVDVRILIDGGVIGDSGIFNVTTPADPFIYTGNKTVAIDVGAIEGAEYDLTVEAKTGAQTPWIEATELGAVIVDSVAPTVTLDDIAEYANPAAITGTASDDTAGVVSVQVLIEDIASGEYSNGSGGWGVPEDWLTAAGTETWSYDSSSVGWVNNMGYTVKARATDDATNVTDSADQPSDTFTADTAVPTVFISTTVDDPTSVAPSVIEGTANDALSGVQKVEVTLEFAEGGPYYWDGNHWVVAESWLEAEGTESWSFAVPTLTSGRTYTVTAKATDNAANDSAVDDLAFLYDTGAPTVVITAPTDEGYYKADFDTITGTSSGAVKAEVLLKDDTASLYWDGDSWEAEATWLDAGGPDAWSYDVAVLSDDNEENGEFSDGSSYTVTAKATDNATPANDATAQATFTYDLTAAAVTIDDIPDYVVSLAEITGTASDAGSGVASVTLTIVRDGDGLYSDGAGNWAGGEDLLNATTTDEWVTWSYDSSTVGFEDGKSYTVTARATDVLGLVTEVADRPEDSFTLDSLPGVVITDIVDFVDTLDAVDGTASDDIPGAVTLVQLKIENTTDSTYWTGAAWGAETWLTAAGTETWSYNTAAVTLEDAKSYTVTAKSQDNVGQWSAIIVEDSFVCDTTAPTVSITDLPVEAMPLVIAGTTSDAGTGVDLVQLTIVRDEDGYYWEPGASWEATEFWIDATTTVDFWSYDTAAVTFVVDKSYTVTARAIDGLDLETAEEDYASETFTYKGTFFVDSTIDLEVGWNLISLPLVPTVSSIDTVVAGADATINKVAYYTGGPDGDWQYYSPGAPVDLNTMDAGKGYWIDVSAGGTTLICTGIQLALLGQSPPTYDVVAGWNLIGFIGSAPNVDSYLGSVWATVEAMYSYNATNGLYEVPVAGEPLIPGEGYWLAVSEDGTIFP